MKTPKSSLNVAAKRVGSFIRGRRRQLNLSRAELARRLGLVLGSHISHVERGEVRISTDAMANWARALELDAAAFSRHIDMLYSNEPVQVLTIDGPLINLGEAASECPPCLA